jgi:hypothetical protein
MCSVYSAYLVGLGAMEGPCRVVCMQSWSTAAAACAACALVCFTGLQRCPCIKSHGQSWEQTQEIAPLSWKRTPFKLLSGAVDQAVDQLEGGCRLLLGPLMGFVWS